MSCRHTLSALCLLLPTLPGQAPAAAEPPRQTVGMPLRLENVILPAPELEPVPPPPDAVGIVRIAAVRPHGTALRYDLVFTAFEPGRHDVTAFLRRKDGTPVADLPPLPVQIDAVLPPERIEPNELEAAGLPRIGGYRFWMWTAGIVWVLGLVGLIWWMVRGRRQVAAAAAAPPPTMAERLRPLVQAAMAGELTAERRAHLERMLITYWSRRLGLEQQPAAAVFAVLRRHAEAGPLVQALERWLHSPPGRADDLDVTALLRPYQDAPAESAPAPAAATGTAP